MDGGMYSCEREAGLDDTTPKQELFSVTREESDRSLPHSVRVD